MKNLSKLDS